MSPANERLVRPGLAAEVDELDDLAEGKERRAVVVARRSASVPWKLGVIFVVVVSALPSQRTMRLPSTTTASEPSEPNFAYVMPPFADEDRAVADDDLIPDCVGDFAVPRVETGQRGRRVEGPPISRSNPVRRRPHQAIRWPSGLQAMTPKSAR